MAAAARERGLEAGEGAGETIVISPGPSFYLHKYRARDEQTRVEDPRPSQHPPSDCADSYRSAPRVSSSSPPSLQPNGHQRRADAYRCLLHVACKAALLEYEDFLWL